VSQTRVQRKLAAILAADVAGYSRLIGEDEEGTFASLTALRNEIVDADIARFGGRIANTAGDSVLAEFPSVIEAIRCAIGIQHKIAERNAPVPEERRIRFRIGLHVGDVIDQGGDLLGDGVNVAARLEGLSEPGGICLSRAARDQVRDRIDVALEDLGEVPVKNIERPVRVFRVVMDGTARKMPGVRRTRPKKKPVIAAALAAAPIAVGVTWWQPWVPHVERASVKNMAYALPDKPSIAVLPFTNMSDDKEQELFSDGITEDIITDLSKVSGLFVVARNSSFTFKGKATKVRQIAEDLGVRYVLEGSVRRTGDKLRITTQLSDVIRGKHLWSERYDRNVSDVFAVQSDVAARVVKAMAVTLKANELDRLFQKQATNIDAYDAFVRARRLVDPPGAKSIVLAQQLFRRAIDLDPDFAGGYAGISFSYSSKARLRLGDSPETDAKLSLEFAKKAIEVDRNFAGSHIALAGAYLANGNADAAVEAAREAIRLQPNGYEENLFMGFYLTFAGQSGLAVKHLEAAKRISPVDSVRGLAFLANAYFMDGQYAKSEGLRKQRIEKFPVRNPNPYLWLAATQSRLGKAAEAAVTAAKFRELRPDFRLSKWRYFDYYKSSENRERLYRAALKAGIPE
jgi:adenylate cyclase